MNMKLVLGLGLGLLLLMLAGCDLSGTVTDTISGDGIEGVRVSILATNSEGKANKDRKLFSTVTNEDGEYRMSSFLVRSKSNSPLAVRFSKPGYAFEPEIVYVALNEDNKALANAEGMPLR